MGGGSFVGLGSTAGRIKIKAAGKDGNGNDGKADKDDPAVEAGDHVEAGEPSGVAESEGLEHTTHTVDEVHTKEAGGDEVKGGDPDVLEARDHHVVDVEGHDGFAVLEDGFAVFHEGNFVGRQDGGVVVFHTRDTTDSEVGEVKKDKGKEDDTAHAHGAGGVGGLHNLFYGVALRAGAAVVQRE